MTNDEINDLMKKIGRDMIEFSVALSNQEPKISKIYVLTAMAGALAALSSAAGVRRDIIAAVLDGAFSDIEGGSSHLSRPKGS